MTGFMTSNPSSNRKTGQQRRKRRTAPVTTASAEEYKVGPGRPPKEYQYKPGQSGNPKGRKRKPPSLLPDLKQLFDDAMGEELTVTHGGKKMILTMAGAGFKWLARQHAQGDRHARREVVAYAEKFASDLLAGHRKAIEEALSADHQAILDAYVARRTQATGPSRSSPVLAPAELLDDDTEDPE